MNRKNIIGFALIVAAAALAVLACSSVGDYAARLIGKAVWYLPYASLMGGVSMLRGSRSRRGRYAR